VTQTHIFVKEHYNGHGEHEPFGHFYDIESYYILTEVSLHRISLPDKGKYFIRVFEVTKIENRDLLSISH
jgi:hypothetical protein